MVYEEEEFFNFEDAKAFQNKIISEYPPAVYGTVAVIKKERISNTITVSVSRFSG